MTFSPLARMCTHSVVAAATLVLLASPLAQAQTAVQAAAPLDAPHVWDLTPLFASPQDWEAGRQAVLAALPRLQALKGSVAKGGAKDLLVAVQMQSAL